jgi:ankyrin repeat protein
MPSAEGVAELFEALASCDLERVENLLDHGVPIDVRDADKDTPLHKASFWGMKPMAEALIRRGAPMELHNKDKDSPLTMAVGGGEKELVALLLEHNAFVSHRNKWNSTPLHKAAYKGHRDCAILLIGKNAEINAVNDAGDLPLHRACENGHKEVADILLGHGALINAHNKAGATPMHFAARWGHKDAVSLLLRHGAAVDERAGAQETPLHFAAASTAKGVADVASLLLENGASLHAVDAKSETPLHAGVCAGCYDMVALLVARGAALDALNADGKSPLDLAKELSKCEAIALLEEAALASRPHAPRCLAYDVGGGAPLVVGVKTLLSPMPCFDCGNPAPTFTVDALPEGFTISPSSGAICGVASQEFRATVTVTAANELGDACAAVEIEARRCAPKEWTREQVQDWLKHELELPQADCAALRSATGQSLFREGLTKQMLREDFRELSGAVLPSLYLGINAVLEDKTNLDPVEEAALGRCRSLCLLLRKDPHYLSVGRTVGELSASTDTHTMDAAPAAVRGKEGDREEEGGELEHECEQNDREKHCVERRDRALVRGRGAGGCDLHKSEGDGDCRAVDDDDYKYAAIRLVFGKSQVCHSLCLSLSLSLSLYPPSPTPTPHTPVPSPSLCRSVCLSLPPCLPPCLPLCLSLSPSLPAYLSLLATCNAAAVRKERVSLCLCLCLCLSVSVSVSVSVFVSVSVSVSFCLCPCLYLQCYSGKGREESGKDKCRREGE